MDSLLKTNSLVIDLINFAFWLLLTLRLAMLKNAWVSGVKALNATTVHEDLDLDELEALAKTTAANWAENAFESLDTNGIQKKAVLQIHHLVKGREGSTQKGMEEKEKEAWERRKEEKEKKILTSSN